MAEESETLYDSSDSASRITVADARHILACEGGEMSGWSLVFQLVMAALVAAALARAIEVGSATVWHLLLPMLAQYVALMVALPPIYLVVRHPDLRKDTIGTIRLWIIIAAALAITVAGRAWWHDTPWREQLDADARRLWRWIADAQMHWPILLAFLGSLAAVPGRVRNLFVHGPPFVGVSLGCAMRIAVGILGFIFIPFALSSEESAAWGLWWLIVIAELLALWMHWDLQQKVKRHDAGLKSK
jgi:hypothetical protein